VAEILKKCLTLRKRIIFRRMILGEFKETKGKVSLQMNKLEVQFSSIYFIRSIR